MESILTHFEAYLLTHKRVAKNTVTAYMTDLMQLVEFLHAQNIALSEATYDHLKEFLQMLHDQGVGARSRSRKVSSIKAFYKWAHTVHGWQDKALTLVFPKLEKRLPRYLSEYQIELLLQTAQKDNSPIGIRNKVMVYLLYVTGMRITELVSLLISDIHTDTSFVKIVGKGGRERLVPIPQPMLSLLQSYIDQIRPQLIASSVEPPNVHDKKKQYLFPVIYGGIIKSISRQSFWIILKGLCIAAGITQPVSPHMLRHSLATHLLHKGAHLRSLQLLLGHETINTVHVYTHLETDHMRKVYDKKHPRA